ncbi:MAG: DNA polymerase III subunit delta [Deltaproteobacteria bacterium]|jgi:DNA polymerase-3 subunit delta|nr:DNA polymerase III subunit delta [Deltaproteobacteria bacterium]
MQNYSSKQSFSSNISLSISLKELITNIKKALSKNLDNPETIIEKSGISSPLVLACDQELRIKRLVAWIRDNIFNGGNNNEVSFFFGSEISSEKQIQQIINSAKNISLFSPYHLIVIYEADKIEKERKNKTSEKDKPTLTSNLIQTLSKEKLPALLILTAQEIKKTSWLSKLEASATYCVMPKFSPTELGEWILKEIKGLGHNGGITEESIQFLITRYADDLFALAHEIEKLCLLLKPTETITKKLVEQLTTKDIEKNVFELIDNLANKDFLKVSYLLKKLENQNEPMLKICATLSTFFRSLIAQKSFNNVGGVEPAAELNKPWVRRYGSAFSMPDLVKALNILKDLDLKMKSTSPQYHLLEADLAFKKIGDRG